MPGHCRPRADCAYLRPAFPPCVISLQGPAQVDCVDLRLPPVRDSLLASPGHRAGRPQCRSRANCDSCAYLRPAFPQCVSGLRGPGAHSVGQGLTVTAAYLQFVTQSLLAGPRGPGAQRIGQGLSVTAAYVRSAMVPHSLRVSPVYEGQAPTVSPKACCDSCAYVWFVTKSLLAGPQGRSPTVLAPAHCVGRRPSPTRATLTHARRTRLAVSGQTARVSEWVVGCWTCQGRRNAHTHLDRNFGSSVSRPARNWLGWLSRTASNPDPSF